MKTFLATIAVLALAGCGAPKQSTETAAQTPATTATPATDAGTGAPAVAANQIAELTDQTLIYECPKCGMMFDAAGTCSMDGSALVATQVSYSCPKDNKPVAQAGQCPRCAMNARVDKTAMAGGVPPDKH